MRRGKVRFINVAQPLALTAYNELRKLPPVTFDLRRLTNQVNLLAKPRAKLTMGNMKMVKHWQDLRSEETKGESL